MIADFEVTEQMLRYFLRKAQASRWSRPRVVMCVPSGVTEVETRAVEEACLSAGARQVALIEEPIAAAIGAGLDIAEPTGHMVVDIGGGTSEVAVISMGEIVVETSLRLAGYDLDEAIMAYVRRHANLAIGQPSAEEIKIQAGSAFPMPQTVEVEVRGRELLSGLPRTVMLDSDDIRAALAEPVQTIVDAVRETLDQTPPELSADILTHGILLAGGGALLHGLAERLRGDVDADPVADSPLTCVAVGAGEALEEFEAIARRQALARRRARRPGARSRACAGRFAPDDRPPQALRRRPGRQPRVLRGARSSRSATACCSSPRPAWSAWAPTRPDFWLAPADGPTARATSRSAPTRERAGPAFHAAALAAGGTDNGAARPAPALPPELLRRLRARPRRQQRRGRLPRRDAARVGLADSSVRRSARSPRRAGPGRARAAKRGVPAMIRSMSSRSSTSFSSSARASSSSLSRCSRISFAAPRIASSVRCCCSSSRSSRVRSETRPPSCGDAARGDRGAHRVVVDHRARDLGDAREVVGGAGGDRAEHDLLRGAAAEQHGHVVDQLLARLEVAVLLREVERVAQRAPARHDRDLVHAVDARQQLGAQRVAGLVERDDAALVVVERAARLHAGHDALERGVEVGVGDELAVLAGREDRRLVAEVREVGAGQARRLARDHARGRRCRAACRACAPS